MKSILLLLCLCLPTLRSFAQTDLGFSVVLEEWKIPDAPAAHSFAIGVHDGTWLIVGGRTDGLHRPQPFAAFDPAAHNRDLIAFHPETGTTWRQSVNGLPVALREQLQSTNIQFTQVDTVLYMCGGYGYSNHHRDFITHPLLVAINLPGCIRALQTGRDLLPHMRYVEDGRMRVTGGQMAYQDGEFLLVGGHDFEGVYNPNGPDFGPGFFQAYTNEVRRFRIGDDGKSIHINSYSALHDSLALHRRDYNLVWQVQPGGQTGLTIYSGVFQYAENVPWLSLVDLQKDGVKEVPDFEQLLNHYHCAHLPIYNSVTGQMHTFFFGGMARYYILSGNDLMDDVNVPFVKTIARVTRNADGTAAEFDTGERMPGFLGAGAEFIHLPGTPRIDGEIVDLASLKPGRNLVGYIYGGLESSADNIFFTNTDVESWASARVFKVFIDNQRSMLFPEAGSGLQLMGWQDAGRQMIVARAQGPESQTCVLELADVKGRVLASKPCGKLGSTLDPVTIGFDVRGMQEGTYFLNLHSGQEGMTRRVELR